MCGFCQHNGQHLITRYHLHGYRPGVSTSVIILAAGSKGQCESVQRRRNADGWITHVCTMGSTPHEFIKGASHALL